jgi:hypothetical protein
MKRFIFWFIAALVAFSALRHHRRHDEAGRESWYPRPIVIHRSVPQGTHQPVYYVDGDKHTTYTNIAPLKDRYGDRIIFAFGDDDDEDFGPSPRRVSAEGLPVPIVAGSRVTEARPEPPTPPKPPKPPKPAKRSKRSEVPQPPTPPTLAMAPAPVETSTVTGRLSAPEERAKKDAETMFAHKLVEKLSPEVASNWEPPARLVRKMILETTVTPHNRTYGTVYDATLKVDVSPARRAEILGAYHHEKLLKRLAVLGGGLLFVLTCLGAVSSYIRTDEATKGYYTNALRLAAAAGVGGAGMAIYHILA